MPQQSGVQRLNDVLGQPPALLFDPLLADLEERTFRFFWDTANPKNGLVPDRYPTPSFASIAAVGFALTAYPVGVERAISHVRKRGSVCWPRCASLHMHRPSTGSSITSST